MARVFIVAPYVPNGGTLMAYHLGRILHRHFGYEGIAVTIGDESPETGNFEYDPVFPSIDIEQLPRAITDDDILIANPSFSSLGLGFTCRGRKIMYIQGFNTFDLLDCRFDLYVSVSTFVRKFIHTVYGLETPVIPPFLPREALPAPRPWSQRPANTVLVCSKGSGKRRTILLERIAARIAERNPDVRLTPMPAGPIPHRDFVAKLGEVRYLLSLSPAEGFGLVPLEAMAMGTTVIGFDGFGGRDYLLPEVNCACAPWPRFEDLADRLLALLDDAGRAQALAEQGRWTAARQVFTYEHFRDTWKAQIAAFLNL